MKLFLSLVNKIKKDSGKQNRRITWEMYQQQRLSKQGREQFEKLVNLQMYPNFVGKLSYSR